MQHGIHKVVGFEKVAPYTLQVKFADGMSQTIDFAPAILHDGPRFFPDLRKLVETWERSAA